MVAFLRYVREHLVIIIQINNVNHGYQNVLLKYINLMDLIYHLDVLINLMNVLLQPKNNVIPLFQVINANGNHNQRNV